LPTLRSRLSCRSRSRPGDFPFFFFKEGEAATVSLIRTQFFVRKNLAICVLVSIAFLYLSAERSSAGPITTLFGTGLDGSGNLLANGAVDPHYTVIGGPSAPSAFVIGNPEAVPWVGNTATSQWISPAPSTLGGLGPFTYTTTFDLTGFDPSTAQISGFWSADDQGEMFLNGNPVASTPGVFSAPWNSLFAFNITSGFIPGINTLSFFVPNGTEIPAGAQGPTGLQVEITSATALPEPSTMVIFAMVSIGGAGFAALRRRKFARS